LTKVKYNCQRNEGLLNLRRKNYMKTSRRKTPIVMIAGVSNFDFHHASYRFARLRTRGKTRDGAERALGRIAMAT
jgi:hypothetical protein